LLLLQGLRERGHDAHLLAVRDSLLASCGKEIGAPVHYADPGRRRFSSARLIRDLLRERKIDLVHANEPHALSAAWLARSHRAVPVVAARRIALPLSPGYFSMARYRAASRIVAVSDFVRRSVIQSGLPGDRVSVIYDGVPIPAEISAKDREIARNELGIPQSAVCIGNVAAFVPEKGHDLLLRAFAPIHAKIPDSILVLRGDGPEKTHLQALAKNLKISEAVKFLPPLMEIETLFPALDIFAFPSHAEPLGSALLAAMAHSLPVAAMASGGVPEIVEDGVTGLLVRSLEAESFADALGRLIAHREEASRLGRAARDAVSKRFSANQMVDETLSLYEKLIMKRNT
jgi:glycosyltransferase involved in cell wall biosynthesis